MRRKESNYGEMFLIASPSRVEARLQRCKSTFNPAGKVLSSAPKLHFVLLQSLTTAKAFSSPQNAQSTQQLARRLLFSSFARV
jgi:hypothetical protein